MYLVARKANDNEFYANDAHGGIPLFKKLEAARDYIRSLANLDIYVTDETGTHKKDFVGNLRIYKLLVLDMEEVNGIASESPA